MVLAGGNPHFWEVCIQLFTIFIIWHVLGTMYELSVGKEGASRIWFYYLVVLLSKKMQEEFFLSCKITHEYEFMLGFFA